MTIICDPNRDWSKKEIRKRKKYNPMSEEGKKNIGKARLGKKHSKESRLKMRLAHKGKKLSEATKIKMRLRKGENSPNWKGGITPVNERIRNSLEYSLWRKAVFQRDNYTCIWCGNKTSGSLNADHIKPFSLFPELRFAIDNGRTLCKDCHKTTDTYGGKMNKYMKLLFKRFGN